LNHFLFHPCSFSPHPFLVNNNFTGDSVGDCVQRISEDEVVAGGAVMIICDTQECKSYANLALRALTNKKQPLGKSLKNFLSTLPKSDLLSDILTTALHQLAQSDPATCRWTIWILKNSSDLEPYFDVIEKSLDLTIKDLENQGIVLGF
jgi:hypothetical protein